MTTAEAAGGGRQQEDGVSWKSAGESAGSQRGRQQIQRRQQEAAQPGMGNASDDAAAEDLSVLSLSLFLSARSCPITNMCTSYTRRNTK